METIDPTICYIKKEFHAKKVEIPEKKHEIEEPPRKKHKGGRNKKRPVFKEAFHEKLCRALVDGQELDKCSRENCKFLHDVKSYMEMKPPDIAEKCPLYTTKGFCTYGITCRFGKEHITEDFKNANSSIRVENEQRVNLSHELQVQLRKKTYDFTNSDNILASVSEIISKKTKDVGSCEDDENVVTRLVEKKKIDFRNKLVLSPLTTVGNLPFRRICKEYGADITVGEMACSVPLINGNLSEWALTRRHSSEDIFGIQIEGNNAKLITYAAQVLSEITDVDFIDLNIGCPIDLIFQQGGGSALLRRQTVLEHTVRSCSQVLKDKPFTVKTRIGIHANKLVAKELLPKLEKWGASAVTIHGRTKEQRYTKSADWNYVNECASLVKEMPVIGNGDVLNLEDYQHIKKTYTNVSSIMIGRGALIKPWIFKEIKEGKVYDISSQERLDIVQKYVNYGLECFGSDTKGVETTRRFLLEWLSFLYRYVPYGILEHPPQKINQRPEYDYYTGRDDLETLMASRQSSDWVKISEMFLGKVPDGFTFIPKHKANSF